MKETCRSPKIRRLDKDIRSTFNVVSLTSQNIFKGNHIVNSLLFSFSLFFITESRVDWIFETNFG